MSVTFAITDDTPDASLSPDAAGGEDSETVTSDGGGRGTVTLHDKSNAEGTNTVSTDIQGGAYRGDADVEAVWALPEPPPPVTIEMRVQVRDVTLKQRSLTVPEGANGIGILDRAVQEGFISSYETAPSGGVGPHRLTCLDHVCGAQPQPDPRVRVRSWWTITENGNTPFSTGVLEAFAAQQGDRFEFSYRDFAYACACI